MPDASKQLFYWLSLAKKQHCWYGKMGNYSIPQWTTLYYWITAQKQTLLLDLELTRSPSEISDMVITKVTCDYTLWHRRMGHAHGHVIKHLNENTEGGPNQTTIAPRDACEGCKKRKSKRLPIPASKSRANKPLDLIHSNLNVFPNCSISRYKWTTTYLGDCSSFGGILKNKDEEFTAFKS